MPPNSSCKARRSPRPARRCASFPSFPLPERRSARAGRPSPSFLRVDYRTCFRKVLLLLSLFMIKGGSQLPERCRRRPLRRRFPDDVGRVLHVHQTRPVEEPPDPGEPLGVERPAHDSPFVQAVPQPLRPRPRQRAVLVHALADELQQGAEDSHVLGGHDQAVINAPADVDCRRQQPLRRLCPAFDPLGNDPVTRNAPRLSHPLHLRRMAPSPRSGCRVPSPEADGRYTSDSAAARRTVPTPWAAWRASPPCAWACRPSTRPWRSCP